MAATPDPVDVHVGNRLRSRRVLVGMSQGSLATNIGLTFQQVQKYERGANRIGASRLFEFSRILGVPVSYFFEDVPGAHGTVDTLGRSDSEVATGGEDSLARRETLELVRAYYRIADPVVRGRMYDLATSLASDGDADTDGI
jgi:transcriptional regulator with XRE-family HTH domain